MPNPYIDFCNATRASAAWSKKGHHRLSVPEQGRLLGQMYRASVGRDAYRSASASSSASSERRMPEISIDDIVNAESLATRMSSYFEGAPKYTLSDETKGLLDQGLTDAETDLMVKGWTAKHPVDRQKMLFSKGNTRLIDNIVGTVHAGSYNGRYVTALITWSSTMSAKRVGEFLRDLNPTQKALMALALHNTTAREQMQGFVRRIQSSAARKRPASPTSPPREKAPRKETLVQRITRLGGELGHKSYQWAKQNDSAFTDECERLGQTNPMHSVKPAVSDKDLEEAIRNIVHVKQQFEAYQ
jgi:hypothetical protein